MNLLHDLLRPLNSGGTPHHAPSIRAERLVALGRVAIAAASLGAIWIDASTPPTDAGIAHGLLTFYAVYAVVLAVIVWHRPARSIERRVATHVLDLAIFTVVIYLTGGATSPFFLYFIFSLLSATLRFRLRGTFWTAVATLTIFIGMGAWSSLVLHDPGFELNRFLIRSVYLAIAAVLLLYLSIHQEQHRHELWRLTVWPRLLSDDASKVLSALLEHAAVTLRTDQAALWWLVEEEGEPRILWWKEGDSHSEPWTGSGVAPELEQTDFHCRDLDTIRPHAGTLSEKESTQLTRHPLDERLRERIDASTLISVRLSGAGFSGRLFVIGTPSATTDDLVLCRILGDMIAARLEEFFLISKLKRMAVAEERNRVSRELHDGALQSLTGIALQLRAAERILGTEPERAIAILSGVRDRIVENQRELRDFVESLRDHDVVPYELPLSSRLMAVAERARVEWTLQVALEMENEGSVPPDLAREVTLMVNEAISNAGKHGAAESVSVRLRASASMLQLEIRDDGTGFPFEGRYDLDELARRNIGPRTLRERVTALGGRLALESSRRGSLLEIEIPVGSAEGKRRAEP
jgi:signal transduction histidine kinase